MKIVFMGTPDFSAKVLEILCKRYDVCAVVTALDKPTGRGYAMQPPALKIKAEELNIPVLQFKKVSVEGLDDIKSLAPDVIVTAAFGQILSEEFLSIPRLGVLNVHASLLPKYRGASPIQHAILDGEEETGVTIMRTVKEVDAGDILLQKRVKIGEKETAGELFDRLAQVGGEAIAEAISALESGKAEFTPQDESLATHCAMISKSDGETDFSRSAAELDRFVRGMTPWPSAYTYLNGKLLKIFEIEIIDDADTFGKIGMNFMISPDFDGDLGKLDKFGVVVAADKKFGLTVTAGDEKAFVRLKQIQLEGSKRMSDTEFLLGNKVSVGTVLGR